MDENEEVEIKTEDGTTYTTTLWDADPNCEHEQDPYCLSGIKCNKCGGWYCL